jgi:hypothetical protein
MAQDRRQALAGDHDAGGADGTREEGVLGAGEEANGRAAGGRCCSKTEGEKSVIPYPESRRLLILPTPFVPSVSRKQLYNL